MYNTMAAKRKKVKKRPNNGLQNTAQIPEE
jgi:hypothetical protein